ncbi:P-loop containing nucleoside triphosphate hydrolase protein [Artomyces pyxidatus]|uniref:P-loop containing nucleoside triphosphate hydrolase protein n=1 Tax=Artomyces pyxidatus TaxID=48021 RepID=A0ACB8SMI8_9AGAM|nr:P-loop containing nucleoside triphosphate hydrolase protein [Artomyces pyxidatus]
MNITLNDTLGANSSLDNTTSTGTTPLTFPTDLSSLVTFIYSFAALRDYLKLIVLGGAFETLRRLYSFSYFSIVDRFFITASFESDDDAFQWMMFWLSSLPEWRKFRDFTVSTSSLGLGSDSVELNEEQDDDPSIRKTRPVRYLPAYAASYKMWYKRRWMTISRVKEESRWYTDKSTLTITILSRNRSVLDSLILEARQKWLSARSDKIDIYAMEGYSSDWRHVTSRPKRPIKSIILDAGVKELILDDARDFLKSRSWYADRGIPFRRGYLLYGAPGSGKTSIIHSLAGELGLDIYIISLSKYGLDDSTLSGLISSLPPECVAIMEDIDAAFTHGLTRDTAGTDLEDPRRGGDPSRRDPDDPNSNNDPREPNGAPGAPNSGSKDTRITLSGLLNALDGVSAQEGRLLFATTNRYSVLDPALTRPGRMDLHVEFRLASRYQAFEMFKRFYIPDADVDEPEAEEEKADGESVDSGYETPTKEKPAGSDLIDLSTPPSPAPSADSLPNYNGVTHSARAPTLSKKQIASLATRFSEAIPEREFSMASLQGFLMAYKVRPLQAVDDVERWVEDKRAERERKSRVVRLEEGRKAVVESKSES